MPEQPLVSIVVPVRRARATIAATLKSLLAQCHSAPAEVIAVVSETDPTAVEVVAVKHPKLRVLVRPGKHGVPQLRRDGVTQARAPWIVITEDHCQFPGEWLREITAVSSNGKPQIRGGPVVNGSRSLVGWAQYFTRYSQFMLPVSEGPARFLPGNNAIYPREVLTANGDLLKDGFWEAEFNEVALQRGCRMWMSPSTIVRQHQRRGVLEYLTLRYRHGRCYGARRIHGLRGDARRKLLKQMPMIPAVLYWRAARAVFRKKVRRATFVLVTPLLFAYFLAWGVGECAGYLFGAGKSCLDTD